MDESSFSRTVIKRGRSAGEQGSRVAFSQTSNKVGAVDMGLR
jgi:hypothetical protein